MGDHRMEHRRPRINTTSPIVSKFVIVETQRQPTGIGVTQSLDVSITTTRVEIVVAPNMDVVKKTTNSICNKIRLWIGWNLDKKESKSKFGTTNNNYWSYWNTSYGVYQSDNDY